MPKTKISEFDTDPSNNTDINSINIAEGCAPSGINNAIRQLMSDLKEQQTGASGDNFTVGGNLTVTGTTVHTGATTFTGAVVFSSTVTGLGLGTMSTQNKTAVDITGGTVVGITDLTVADGGTGASSITANSVILGNGTSALSGNLVAPSTSGNVLTSNGTTWTSAALTAPTVITQQAYAMDTTHSISVSGTRPIALTLSFSSNQGSQDTISADFQWGLGSLANTYTFYTSTSVNFQVSPSGTITVYLTPSGTTTLQFRANTTGSGFQFRNFFVSAIQL
jgi:hypothetical protein